MKTNKIFIRLGFSDIVLTKEENDSFNGHLDCTDENGKTITSTNAYLVGYEDEEGNECDEDGNLF